jgi:hypothetical protein
MAFQHPNFRSSPPTGSYTLCTAGHPDDDLKGPPIGRWSVGQQDSTYVDECNVTWLLATLSREGQGAIVPSNFCFLESQKFRTQVGARGNLLFRRLSIVCAHGARCTGALLSRPFRATQAQCTAAFHCKLSR